MIDFFLQSRIVKQIMGSKVGSRLDVKSSRLEFIKSNRAWARLELETDRLEWARGSKNLGSANPY